MRKPARAATCSQLRDVAERVEVIGLAQPLLAQVDQAQPLELPRERVDPAQADVAIGAFFRTCV